MLFSTVFVTVLAQSLTALADTMVVTVAADNKFRFTPNSITAQPGDVVAFNFVSQNHSVVSSNANSPCQPQRNAIFSDFQPVAGPTGGGANGNGNRNLNGNRNRNGNRNKNNNRQAGNTPMFMVPITDNQPMYIYCSQAQHCQQGMVMVINPPSPQAVAQYAQEAAQANNNVSPRGGVSGGSVRNNAAGTNPRSVLGANAGDAATTSRNSGNSGNSGNNGNNSKNTNAGGNGKNRNKSNRRTAIS
ncbi:hypothetical protein ACN47E_004235 [Coniothyrium glycines]